LLQYFKYRLELKSGTCYVYPWPRKPYSFKLSEVSQYQKIHNIWKDQRGYKIWINGGAKVIYIPEDHYEEFGDLLKLTINRKLENWDRIL